MIEIRKKENYFELVIWTDDDSGVIQKLSIRDLASLKAKLDTVNEQNKILVSKSENLKMDELILINNHLQEDKARLKKEIEKLNEDLKLRLDRMTEFYQEIIELREQISEEQQNRRELEKKLEGSKNKKWWKLFSK